MYTAIKKLVVNIYIILLMIFTLWYGYFIYPLIFDSFKVTEKDSEIFKEYESFFGEGTTEEEKEFIKSLIQQQRTEKTDLGYMVIEEQYIKGHFHHVGMKVETDNYSMCIRCHGAVPHDKAKTIRAFLNMHAFYMACETCHIRPSDDENKYVFRWYEKSTGMIIRNPIDLNTSDESMYGNYSAKISPGIENADGVFQFINGKNELAFVEKYLKEEKRLNDTQKSKMKKIIHRNVNEDPLICDGCHTENSNRYLPFTDLGYPKRRLLELTSTEVVGMIKKYQQFYIPNLLKGGG